MDPTLNLLVMYLAIIFTKAMLALIVSRVSLATVQAWRV